MPAGLSALVDDEVEMGCACIDIGGGTTTISVFSDGKFVHADAIAVGGNHVTMDMARGLSTRLEDAERLKVMHGSALPSAADERDCSSSSRSATTTRRAEPGAALGDDAHHPAARRGDPRTGPRPAERLRLRALVGRRVVLTGGASQLTGLPKRRAASSAATSGSAARSAWPGCRKSAKGPAFATAVGLLIYPQVARDGAARAGGRAAPRMTGTGGYFARVGQWFRDSF